MRLSVSFVILSAGSPLACALLIAEGLAATADEVLVCARQRRPSVRLSAAQKRLLIATIPDLTFDRQAGSPAA